MAAFHLAVSAGADMIEFDVQRHEAKIGIKRRHIARLGIPGQYDYRQIGRDFAEAGSGGEL